jgi:hypothetical protein
VRQQERRLDQSGSADAFLQHENRLVPHSHPRSDEGRRPIAYGRRRHSVEADETFTGRKEGFEVRQGYGHKNAVLTLVERKGRARSFHVEGVKKDDLAPILRAHIKREAHLMTDEANQYTRSAKNLQRMARSTMAARNMSISTARPEPSSPSTALRAISPSSSAAWSASTSIAAIKTGYDDAARAEHALFGVKGKRLTYETTAAH